MTREHFLENNTTCIYYSFKYLIANRLILLLQSQKMKKFLFILLIFCFVNKQTHAQNSIVKAYKNLIKSHKVNPNGKYVKGYWKGLQVVIDSAKVKFGIDLNQEDTLFIITSHPDFVIGGFDEARIWNNKINLSSYNYKDFVANKFYKKIQQISANKSDDQILNETDEIKILIESFQIDTIFKNYIEKCNYLDGSIYEIIWITKVKKKFVAQSTSGRLCVGLLRKR